MVVFGGGFDTGSLVSPLDYIPHRAANVGAERLPGKQVMDVSVYTDGIRYDVIEFRTRHYCDGVRVEGTMLTVEVPE